MRTTIDAERADAISEYLAVEPDFVVEATKGSGKFLLAGSINGFAVIQDAESAALVTEIAAAEVVATVTLRAGPSGEWFVSVSGTEENGDPERYVLQAKSAAIVSKWLEKNSVENVSLGEICSRKYLRYLYSSMLKWGSPHGGRSKNLLWRFIPTLSELRRILLDVPTRERPLALFTGQDQSRNNLLVLATTECIRVTSLQRGIRRCFTIDDPREQITRIGRTRQFAAYCFSQADGQESLWVGGLPFAGMLHVERLFESMVANSERRPGERNGVIENQMETESEDRGPVSPDELDELEMFYAWKAARTRRFQISGYWKLLTGLTSGLLAGYLFCEAFASLASDRLWLYGGTFMCASALSLLAFALVVSFEYKRRATAFMSNIASLYRSTSQYLVAVGLERIAHLVSIDGPFLANLLGVDIAIVASTQNELRSYLFTPPLDEIRRAQGLVDAD